MTNTKNSALLSSRHYLRAPGYSVAFHLPKFTRLGIVLLCLFATLAQRAHAADGDPDPTFSTDGMRQVEYFGDNHYDDVRVATDGQGNTFVAAKFSNGGDGGFAIAKLKPSGANDAAFGALGYRLVSFTDQAERLLGVYPQSDGTIMLLGTVWTGSRYRPAMARLTTSGAIDSSFGDDGRLVLNATPWSNPFFLVDAATRQADGKFVFAGACGACPGDGTFFLRTSASGVPDASFGENGWSSVVYTPSAEFKTLRVDGTGRAVLAGQFGSGTNHRGLVMRVTSSGALDTTFGAGNGFVQISALANASVNAIEFDASQAIMIALATADRSEQSSQSGLVRLLANGTRDLAYAGTGLLDLTLEFGTAIRTLQQRSDGRLIAAGWIDHTGVADGVGKDFLIARVLASGTLDTGFDGNGLRRIALSTTLDTAEAIALSAGKPVIAGFSYAGDEKQLGVLRLQSDLIFRNGLE